MYDRVNTLSGLIGKIPSNPLWAELLAAKMRERESKRSASSTSLGKDRRSASTVGDSEREKARSVEMKGGGAAKTR